MGSVRGLRQVSLVVQDLERATAFYRDVLGLRHLFTAPPGMAFFDVGGIRLLLGAAEIAGGSGSSVLYYDVDDIQAAAAALTARGVRFEAEPRMITRLGDVEVWLAEFTDSEGNGAALMEERPAS